jgi:phage terminase small subunit
MEQPELNTNHQKFIDEYFKQNFNGSAAYSIVYPNCSLESLAANASRLLSNVNVQIELTKRFKELQKRNEIEIDVIIDKVKSLIERCEADDDRKNLVKAIDQLSKLIGAYKPRQVEHINQQPLQINIINPTQEVKSAQTSFKIKGKSTKDS